MDNIILTILYVLAIPSTVVLVLQTVLLLFGIGGEDMDVDTDCDGGFDCDDIPDDFESDAVGNFGDSGLRLFTVRGIIAFLAVGGWAGIAALQLEAPWWLALIAFAALGFGAMVLVAWCIKLALRLQSNGNIRLANAVGLTGEVYMTIPAGGGKGKVNVVVQERYAEIDAVSADGGEIKSGERIKVVGTADDNTVIVEKA